MAADPAVAEFCGDFRKVDGGYDSLREAPFDHDGARLAIQHGE